MSVKLRAEHNLEFLRLKGGYTCSSESTHVKMAYCWKSCVAAQLCFRDSYQGPELQCPLKVKEDLN